MTTVDTQLQALQKRILEVQADNFDALALDVFRFQAVHNPIYKTYLELLKIEPNIIKDLNQIPFLPISLFKQHKIVSGDWITETIYTSSGTTGQVRSQHHIQNVPFYHQIARQGFEHFYGSLTDYCFLALLPSYLERSGSSLVAMVDDFIKRSKWTQSGFFLNDLAALAKQLQAVQAQRIPTVLIGVSFALLDLAEQYQLDLSHCIIMETGGMKGRRKELLRSELHQILGTAFQVETIHSEYGMTELLSQAYSKGGGLFEPIPSMKIMIRELTDPFHYLPDNRNGTINIIDLANVHSCTFIATDDLGKTFADGSFIIHGRKDNSDLRGCNLMIYEL